MDDFKDIVWNSPSSSTPTSTSAAAKPGSNYDPFSMLAASSTANRGTPNYMSSGSGPSSRPLTPSNVAKPQPSTTTSSSDAFSGLLSFGGSSGTGANMSMAERQAQAERKRREEEEKKAQEAKLHGAFWDKFDVGGSLGGGGSSSTILPAKTSANGPSTLLPSAAKPTSTGTPNASFSNILQPSSRPISPAVKPASSPKPPLAAPKPPQGKSSLTVWDFDLLGTSTTPASSSTAQQATKQEDEFLGEFDVFAQQPPAVKSAKASSSAPQRSDSPGDFDWGDREDRDERNGADNYSGDEEDVLGLLSQPVGKVRPKAEPEAPANGRTQSTSPRPPPPASRSPRTSSPPPHVLGKLVEMGFSIQQARIALAATETGADVEAAMEILLTQAAVREEDEREMQQASRGEETEREREAERRRRQQARRQGPSRANVPAAANGDGPAQRRRASGNQEGDAQSPDALGQLADHGNKVLTQASEIGANLLGKANAFWKSANKAYEDRVKTSTPPAPGGPSRPKWMSDAAEHDEPEPVGRRDRQPRKQPTFKDDEGDGHPEDPVLPPRPKPSSSRRPEEPAQPPAAQRDVPTASLFAPAGDTPKSYVSPHRRKPQQQPKAPASPAPPAKPPTPSKPARQFVTCAASALSESLSHRTAGTAAYKLGQFANAEQSFSQAINVLPERHMGLVPLWNNRAMSRLKTGDGPGAVSDCTAVLEIIGVEWKLGDDAPDAGGAHGAGVDLGEALVKATTRRAQAYEMNEKWDKAKEDWEKLAGIGNIWGPAGAKAKTEAFRGLDRCRKALAPPPAPAQSTPAGSSTPKPRAAPKPRPAAPSSSGPSEAAVRLQAANRAAEADEAERYRLKDSVEGRLIAWKGGKENNIRALIASLENVLWPELNWVKVGMHELITEQQVKI
ncbi:hypothetical protein FRC01_012790, partial [Tulasnella sp. 417]